MRRSPLLVLFVTIFIDLMGFGIIIPILPIFATQLGANGFIVGVVAMAYSLFQFLFAPFWGNLSDRIGRRPILLISIVIIACSYVLFAHANTLLLLLLSRVLAGIGAANISAAQAYISDISKPEERVKNFGIIGAAFGLGFIVGPMIGGIIKDAYGVIWVGYFAALMSVFNFVLAYFLLRESLEEKSPDKPLFTNPLTSVIGGLRTKGIQLVLLLNFIFLLAFSKMQITATLLWHEHFHLNVKEIGYVFAYIGLMATLIQGTLLGRLNNWLGEKKLLISGTIFTGIGLLALPLVPPPLFVPLELLAITFLSIGSAFLNPTMSTAVSKLSSRHAQGMALGNLQAVGSLARTFGPLAGGALYDYHYSGPYIIGFALMMGCTVIAIKVSKLL
ncbi:MAG: MFS transporter [Cryomorphaceae bacterium]|nr:MFS transporter [Cryomorphaceae bacterium]